MSYIIRIIFGLITLIMGIVIFFLGFGEDSNKFFYVLGAILAITGFKVLKS